MANFLAILAATVPTVIYTLLIWWLDRYEKEPLPLLIAAFLWGLLPAVALAFFSSGILRLPLSHTLLGPNVGIDKLAPFVEEPIKALALLALFWLARSEFDGILDGIVYGALIGFGFSMSENLLFFLSHPQDLSALFWLRSVAFGLNHAFFTSIVGLALGAVRFARSPWPALIVVPLALLAAIGFHMLHNIAVDRRLPGIVLSWLVQSSGVIAVIAVAVLSWRHESQLIDAELGEEITLGVITASDQRVAASVPRRARVELNALTEGGWSRYQQVRSLHHLLTKLAFCKYQLRLNDPHCSSTTRDSLRQRVIQLRLQLTDQLDDNDPVVA